jgi:hypothetical protein
LVRLHYRYLETGDCDVNLIRQQARPVAINARFIVFGSRFPGENAACFKQAMDLLGGPQVHHYIIFGTKNFGWNNTAIMLLPPAQRYSWRATVRPGAVQSNRDAAQALGADHYVDLLAVLGMGDDGRVLVFTPGHQFISHDQEHLTQAGAHYLAVLLRNHPVLAPMRRAAVPVAKLRGSN